jgi:ABC-type branched-subunit amino acid transport system substrate-binding protein
MMLALSPAPSRDVSRSLLLACATLVSLLSPACKHDEAGKADDKAAAAPAEIKIGQTMPYSGPASAYGTIGKVEAAYFQKINKSGGVNGHPINLISVDDGYNPAKAIEQVRKLVEQDQVSFIFQSLGTPSNVAIQPYLNTNKVPQLFVATGATRWNDPERFPWTIGFNPSYELEGSTYGKYIAAHQPSAKIAVLYQNDDYGKDLLKGLKAGLGDLAKNVVAEVTYEVSDPTVDSQIATLKASGADTFVNVTTPKFAAQAIRKAYDIGWKPKQYLSNVSASVGSVLTPAGLDKAVGLDTVGYFKDPTDKQWDDDPAMKEWKAFMKESLPDLSLADGNNTYAYIAAQTLVQVLEQCGGDLSRANVMKQATSLKGFAPPLLLPGIAFSTGPNDFSLFDQLVLVQFDGTTWTPVADAAVVSK